MIQLEGIRTWRMEFTHSNGVHSTYMIRCVTVYAATPKESFRQRAAYKESGKRILTEMGGKMCFRTFGMKMMEAHKDIYELAITGAAGDGVSFVREG